MAGKKKQVEEVNDSIEFGTNEFFNELIFFIRNHISH